jgi:hypothetical protein
MWLSTFVDGVVFYIVCGFEEKCLLTQDYSYFIMHFMASLNPLQKSTTFKKFILESTQVSFQACTYPSFSKTSWHKG